MKRQGKVIARADVRAGRRLAAWAASGMNWGEGPIRTAVIAAGRRAIGGGALALAELGKRSKALSDMWWQSEATELLGCSTWTTEIAVSSFDELPFGAVELGTVWENDFEFPREIMKIIEAGHTVYVVREYHYNGEKYEQWSDTYFA